LSHFDVDWSLILFFNGAFGEGHMLAKNVRSNVILILVILMSSAPACQSQTTLENPVPQPQPEEPVQHLNLETVPNPSAIPLPEPDLDGLTSLEQALAERRSVRDFRDEPLTQAQIGQLLWAAQGITHPNGYRTAPSAGALYPLEVYAATQDGLFHYNPEDHSLTQTLLGDPRPALYEAALAQDPVREAPLVIAISGVYARTIIKYGEKRAPLYVHLEAGHVAQNILLQAVALGLGAVPIGGFYADQVKDALALPGEQTPLYLIAVGRPE
jgi:SagB-type dehydrogenase family enzyme